MHSNPSSDNLPKKCPPGMRPRRNTILDRKLHVAQARSYRAMSPSRFLEYPLANNSAIYSYNDMQKEIGRKKEIEQSKTLLDTSKTGEGSITELKEDVSKEEKIDKTSKVDKEEKGDKEEDDEPVEDVSLSNGMFIISPPSKDTPFESMMGKERIDYLQNAIAQLYYRKKSHDAVNLNDAVSRQHYDLFSYPTLHLLMSPFRKTHVLDKWTAKEMVLFEAGITGIGEKIPVNGRDFLSLGKDFHSIQKLLQTKSTNEVVDFYHVWKKSAHYAVWKHFGRLCDYDFAKDTKFSQWSRWAELGNVRGPEDPPLKPVRDTMVGVLEEHEEALRRDVLSRMIFGADFEDGVDGHMEIDDAILKAYHTRGFDPRDALIAAIPSLSTLVVPSHVPSPHVEREESESEESDKEGQYVRTTRQTTKRLTRHLGHSDMVDEEYDEGIVTRRRSHLTQDQPDSRNLPGLASAGHELGEMVEGYPYEGYMYDGYSEYATDQVRRSNLHPTTLASDRYLSADSVEGDEDEGPNKRPRRTKQQLAPNTPAPVLSQQLLAEQQLEQDQKLVAKQQKKAEQRFRQQQRRREQEEKKKHQRELQRQAQQRHREKKQLEKQQLRRDSEASQRAQALIDEAAGLTPSTPAPTMSTRSTRSSALASGMEDTFIMLSDTVSARAPRTKNSSKPALSQPAVVDPVPPTELVTAEPVATEPVVAESVVVNPVVTESVVEPIVEPVVEPATRIEADSTSSSSVPLESTTSSQLVSTEPHDPHTLSHSTSPQVTPQVADQLPTESLSKSSHELPQKPQKTPHSLAQGSTHSPSHSISLERHNELQSGSPNEYPSQLHSEPSDTSEPANDLHSETYVNSKTYVNSTLVNSKTFTNSTLPNLSASELNVNDEPVSDEPMSDEPVNDEPVNDEPVNDEPMSKLNGASVEFNNELNNMADNHEPHNLLLQPLPLSLDTRAKKPLDTSLPLKTHITTPTPTTSTPVSTLVTTPMNPANPMNPVNSPPSPNLLVSSDYLSSMEQTSLNTTYDSNTPDSSHSINHSISQSMNDNHVTDTTQHLNTNTVGNYVVTNANTNIVMNTCNNIITNTSNNHGSNAITNTQSTPTTTTTTTTTEPGMMTGLDNVTASNTVPSRTGTETIAIQQSEPIRTQQSPSITDSTELDNGVIGINSVSHLSSDMTDDIPDNNPGNIPGNTTHNTTHNTHNPNQNTTHNPNQNLDQTPVSDVSVDNSLSSTNLSKKPSPVMKPSVPSIPAPRPEPLQLYHQQQLLYQQHIELQRQVKEQEQERLRLNQKLNQENSKQT